VADAESVRAMADRLEGVPIDLLINNAGISGRGGRLAGLDIEEVARVLEVNTLGPMRVTQALLPNLRAGEKKTVVGISSGLGSIAGNTRGGNYGYRESKAALNMFTRTLAADLRDEGFIAIAMSPGWVKTDMGGENAQLEPEQSIAGMRQVIEGLTAEQSGRFLNWDGTEVPW
jgi:NAD(P)-dependent dehydrogenase (short-subunit alcohol dehydrogenase family)